MIFDYSQKQINNNSKRFHQEINCLLKENIPLDEWVIRLQDNTDKNNTVDVFNRQCLHCQ